MKDKRYQKLFAKNLRYLIEEKGHSYRSLSRDANVPFSTISSIIHGTDPTIGIAHKLSVALGKTVDQMVTIDYEEANRHAFKYKKS